jgi:translation initiation factor 2 subunit 1
LDDLDIPEEWKTILMANIRRRMTPQAVKCRADIEVSCYSYEGIDAIKSALKEGLKLSSEEKPIKINLIAPPVYVVTSSSLDREEGVKLLHDVIDKIKASIESYKGRFKVKMPPKVVTDLDEAELVRQMDLLEQENEEVAGDTETEESEENDSNEEDEDGSKQKGDKVKKLTGAMENVKLKGGSADEDENDDDDQSWS